MEYLGLFTKSLIQLGCALLFREHCQLKLMQAFSKFKPASISSSSSDTMSFNYFILLNLINQMLKYLSPPSLEIIAPCHSLLPHLILSYPYLRPLALHAQHERPEGILVMIFSQ